jgi:hypothetical protein
MAFDVDEILGDMSDAIESVLAGEWPAVRTCVRKALQDQRDAMDAIARARIANEISDEEATLQLEDEKVALTAALLACKVKAKVMTQEAANAAIKVLSGAIRAALKVI